MVDQVSVQTNINVLPTHVYHLMGFYVTDTFDGIKLLDV